MSTCDSARPKKGKAFAVPLAKGESVKIATVPQEQVTDREAKRIATDVPAESRDEAVPQDRDAVSSQPPPAKKSKTKAASVAKSKLTDADYDEIFRAVIGSCQLATEAIDSGGGGGATKSEQAEPCRTNQASCGSALPAVAQPRWLEATATGSEQPASETGVLSLENDEQGAGRKTSNPLEALPAVPTAAAQPPLPRPGSDVDVSESGTEVVARNNEPFVEAQQTMVADPVRNGGVSGHAEPATEAGAPLCEAVCGELDRQSLVAAPSPQVAALAALPTIGLATSVAVAAGAPLGTARTSPEASNEPSSSGTAAEGLICKVAPNEIDHPPSIVAQAPKPGVTTEPSTASLASPARAAAALPAREVQVLPSSGNVSSCGSTKAACPRTSKTLKKGLSDREYGELFASVLKASRENQATETSEASRAGKKIKGPADVAKCKKRSAVAKSPLPDELEDSDTESPEQLTAIGGGRNNTQDRSSALKEKKMPTSEENYREEPGVWVQCCKSTCGKWRFLPYVQDPSELADVRWDCSMNKDTTYADCSVFEEKWQTDGSYVYAKVTEGTLVVAKVTGYPWWPAMIEADPDEETYVHVLESNPFEPDEYHVVFFDKGKVTRAWIPATAIKLFKTQRPQDDEMAKLGTLYYERIKEAFYQAQDASSMSLTDRLAEYGFENRKKTRNRQRKTTKNIPSDPRDIINKRKVSPKKNRETSELHESGSARSRSKRSSRGVPAANPSLPGVPSEDADKDTTSALHLSFAGVSVKDANCSEGTNSAGTSGLVTNEQPDTALEGTMQSSKLQTAENASNDPAVSLKTAVPRPLASRKAKAAFVAPVVHSRPSAPRGDCQRPASDCLEDIARMPQTEELKHCNTAAHERPDMTSEIDSFVLTTEDAEARSSAGSKDDHGVDKECDPPSAKKPRISFSPEEQTDFLAAPKVPDVGTGDVHDNGYIQMPLNLKCGEESDPFEIEEPDQATDLSDMQACKELCDRELPFQPEAKRRCVERDSQHLDSEESVAACVDKAASRSAEFEESDPFEMDDSCDAGAPARINYEDLTPLPKDDGSDQFVIDAPDSDKPAPWQILTNKLRDSDGILQRKEE